MDEVVQVDVRDETFTCKSKTAVGILLGVNVHVTCCNQNKVE